MLHLPVLHEILLQNEDLSHIHRELKVLIKRKRPYLINLLDFDNEAQEKIIITIESFFEDNNISSQFPYPIYVLSDLISLHSELPIFDKKSDIPPFFIQKERKTTSKETFFLNKNHLLLQKINQLNFLENEKMIHSFAREHKQLYYMVYQGLMYENLLQKMKDQTLE